MFNDKLLVIMVCCGVGLIFMIGFGIGRYIGGIEEKVRNQSAQIFKYEDILKAKISVVNAYEMKGK